MAKDAIDEIVDWQMGNTPFPWSRPMFEVLEPEFDYDAKAIWTRFDGWVDV